MKIFLKVGLVLSVSIAVLLTSSQLVSAQMGGGGMGGGDDRRTNRVQSIPAELVTEFEAVQAAMEANNDSEALRILTKIDAEEEKNNITQAYINNFRGNIYFSQDNYSRALTEFRGILDIPEGVPPAFYNQILYVVAQVHFSQENFREALNFGQRWFNSLPEKTADGYLLIGQAQFMLKEFDAALPNVQAGISKYEQLGLQPKEGWLNLLSSIYRNKNDYAKMLPVIKQLIQFYPKKDYLLTMAGVYNELGDRPKMTAMYQAMYDQDLLSSPQVITLAQLHMAEDNPYKTATIMEKALNEGKIEKNLQNYRIYSQALFVAKEHERALAPLAEAARRAPDGKMYNQLGQSYLALSRWQEADEALTNALNKGGLNAPGQALISQGLARFEQKNYEGAKAAFNRALQYSNVASSASNWIKYVDSEVYRINELSKPVDEIDVDV